MKHIGYNESRQRGRFDFPIEFHSVTCRHPHYTMPYHWHIEYELIRILQGEFSLSLNEENITAKTGDIVFIRDGIVHGGTPKDEHCIYECIVLNMDALLKNISICKNEVEAILEHSILIYNYFTEKNTAIHTVIWQLFDALKRQGPGYEFIFQGNLYHFLGLVLKEKLYSSANDYVIKGIRKHIHKLKQALKLIDTSYTAPLTLDQLAEAAGLSPKYFCKFFQKMTHRTPIDYLNYYRIEAACSKLTASTMSITDIAYDCGFNDLSYFIKTFKKYKGTTPNRYLSTMAATQAQDT
jgi:AraC-like DNA-binding protein